MVEVFSEWSGPCRSVLPTFKRIRIDKDDESCLQFITVSVIDRLDVMQQSTVIQHPGLAESC